MVRQRHPPATDNPPWAKNKLTRLKISGQKIMLCGAFDVIPNDYDADTTFLYIDRLNDYFKIKYDAWHQAILSVNPSLTL